MHAQCLHVVRERRANRLPLILRQSPFSSDAVTRDLLNQIFGYEIIQQPNRGGYGNNDSQRPFHSAEQLHLTEAGERTNGNGKNGYVRPILPREEDAEVKF